MRPMQLAGLRFGRLVVLAKQGVKNSNSHWLCRCDCGNETVVAGCHLKSGHTSSCGCFHRERTGDTSRTHGHSNGGGRQRSSPAYSSWQSMKHRCFNPNSTSYARYGAIGVTVCERWMSFENFFADMGERPPGTSLDRINPFGNYEPGNCRWASHHIQRINRRSTFAMRRDSESSQTRI